MKKILLLLFLAFLLFPQKTFAVTTTITNHPSSISSEPFTVEVSISGALTGTNYLRADLYKERTQNYFGETYNGSIWYGDSVYNQYFPVSITSGATASASFQAKVGNPTTEYDGAGNYRLRIRRYTSKGGYSAEEANSGSVPISIVTSTPTPTPTPSPTPSPTPTPKPATPKPSTPKPTVSSTPTSTPKPTTISVKISKDIEKSPEPVVLPAATRSASPAPSATPKPVETKVASENNFQKILVVVGLIFIISSGFWFVRSLKRNE